MASTKTPSSQTKETLEGPPSGPSSAFGGGVETTLLRVRASSGTTLEEQFTWGEEDTRCRHCDTPRKKADCGY